MVKPIITLLGLLTSLASLNAQWSLSDVNSSYYQAFKKAPMIVELTGCEAIDLRLRAAMAEYWDQGEFVFSDEVDASELRAPDRVILHAGVLHLVASLREFNDVRHAYLNDWEICVNQVEPDNSLSNVLAYALTSCFPRDICDVDRPHPRCASDVELAIVQLNDAMRFLRTSGFDIASRDWFTTLRRYGTSFNKQSDLSGMAARPLLISRSSLSGLLTEAELDKVYPYPHELVDDARFWELVSDRNPGYYYLFLTDTPTPSISIHDMSIMRTIYLDSYAVKMHGANYTSLLTKDVRSKVQTLARNMKEAGKK